MARKNKLWQIKNSEGTAVALTWAASELAALIFFCRQRKESMLDYFAEKVEFKQNVAQLTRQ